MSDIIHHWFEVMNQFEVTEIWWAKQNAFSPKCGDWILVLGVYHTYYDCVWHKFPTNTFKHSRVLIPILTMEAVLTSGKLSERETS